MVSSTTELDDLMNEIGFDFNGLNMGRIFGWESQIRELLTSKEEGGSVHHFNGLVELS